MAKITLVSKLEDGSDAPRPMIPLFSIDGTDYLVPAQPSAAILVRFLRKSKTDELGAANDMLEDLLGETGYAALGEWDDLTGEQFQDLIKAAVNLIMGTDGGPKAGATR